MDERRKWVRVRCELYCGYDDAPDWKPGHSETASTAVVHDLSETGMRLLVFEFLPVGRKVRARLEIPHTEPIETVLEVMWVSELPRADGRFEIGGRFTTLADDQRAAIRLYLYTESIQRAA